MFFIVIIGLTNNPGFYPDTGIPTEMSNFQGIHTFLLSLYILKHYAHRIQRASGSSHLVSISPACDITLKLFYTLSNGEDGSRPVPSSPGPNVKHTLVLKGS